MLEVKIGFPLWYGDREKASEKIFQIKEAGFDYVEISLDYPWPTPETEEFWKNYGKIIDLGLRVSIHGPWRDVKLASPVELIRKASVDYCKEVLNMVSEIKPDYVVFHLSSEQAVKESKKLEEAMVNSAASSINDLMEFVKPKDMKIVFENVPKGCSSPTHFKHLVKQSNCYFCLDIGHAVMDYVKRKKVKGIVDIEKLIREWLDVLGSRLIVLHVHSYKKQGKFIYEHLFLKPNSRLIKEVCKLLCEIKVEYVLLEVFHGPKGESIEPIRLKKSLNTLRSLIGHSFSQLKVF